MLLHLRPRLYCPFRNVSLVDLRIDALGLYLVGGVDLVARRPYPNKRYAVACRKQGHKAIDGILIETSAPVEEFHYAARWAVEAATVVTHHVDYKLLDHEFDATSDDMCLWYACSEGFGNWSSRWPDWAKDLAPCRAEPKMEILAHGPWKHPGDTEDIFDESGWIQTRRESFAMPTIERERLLASKLNDRIPALNAAFHPVAGAALPPVPVVTFSRSCVSDVDDDVPF